LTEDVAAEVCLKAMALWRPAVEHDSVIPAQTPIVGLNAIERNVTEPVDLPTSERETAAQVQPSTRQAPAAATQSGGAAQEWIPLSEFQPQLHTSPPIEIQFPDHEDMPIKRWNAITVEVVKWLFTHEFLNQSNWNIRQNVRFFVSDSKRHSSGKEFKNPHQVGPLWVEGDFTGVNHVKNTCFIIEQVGQDPAQFKVRLST